MVGQPAEEKGAGAKAMLAEGLFTRFPTPDYCLALHVEADLPVGNVGRRRGCVMANNERRSHPPPLHSKVFAPVAETTIKTGINAMTAAALELFKNEPLMEGGRNK